MSMLLDILLGLIIAGFIPDQVTALHDWVRELIGMKPREKK